MKTLFFRAVILFLVGLCAPYVWFKRPDTVARRAEGVASFFIWYVTPGVIVAPRAHGRGRDARGARHPGPAMWP